MDDMNWRKSSYSSGNGGECILAANISETVAVKDSKIPDSPVLAFDRQAWRVFTDALKKD